MQELWGINFSEEGVKAVILAQEEARRLGHNFIGTEHILLGLHPACREVRNLFKDKATLQLLRVETEAIIGRGSGFVAIDIPRTPRTKEVLKIAEELARG